MSEVELEAIRNYLVDLENVDALSEWTTVQASLQMLYKREHRLADMIDEMKRRSEPQAKKAEKLLEMLVDHVARLLDISSRRAGSGEMNAPLATGPNSVARGAAYPGQAMAAHRGYASAPPQLPAVVLDGPPEIPPDEILYDERRDRLGGGAFADVYKAICRGKKVAVKVPRNQELTDRQLKSFRHEVTINKKIFHPNVVLFLGACTRPRHLFIVTELMSCDLQSLLDDGPKWAKFSLGARLRMAHDAALGMNWLHGICQIIHRDLKPANLMLDENGRVKVSDFGFSEVLRGGRARDKLGAKGTALYMAPEVMKMEEFDQSADVYSFGLILWEMLEGHAPFCQCQDIESLFQTVCTDGERPPIDEKATPAAVVALLRRCWIADPAQRGTFQDVVRSLEDAIAETSLASDAARAFWARRFLHPLVESVPWSDCEAAVAEDADCPPVAVASLCAMVGTPVTTVLGTETGRVVSIERFGMFAQWFGPFFERISGRELIREMQALAGCQWFHGDIKQDEAESRLHGRADRTFLVRLSYKDPCHTPFTLTKIRGNKYVHQRINRVEYAPDAPVRYEFKQSDGTIARTLTLPDLVARLKGCGSIAAECPCQSIKSENY